MLGRGTVLRAVPIEISPSTHRDQEPVASITLSSACRLDRLSSLFESFRQPAQVVA